MDKDLEPDRTLDCLGLYCPEPVFRTRLTLDEMEAGEVLEVTADDPAADEDLRRLARRLGHEIVGRELNDGVLKILIRKTR
jgi:tRNA 2-thiouridine synthesizing protein A